MAASLIEFKDVSKRFDHRTVLDRVNLTLEEGEITTLIGKSGTGKSVLLKHMIGLLTPDEGAILFRGRSIQAMGRGERDAYLSQLSYMFQNNALFDSLTVFENIALPLEQTTELTKAEIKQRVMAKIEQVELEEVTHKYPSQISGGMQKRVALARALVTEPQIVLFDEPTTGQDPIRKNAILSMIASYQRKFGFTAVLVSHDIPDVFFISNRILVLHEGQIIFSGPPSELDKFSHPFFDEFVASLEGFQQELTGLYSKRHFKLQYQRILGRGGDARRYVMAIFSLDDLDRVSDRLGHVAAQEMMKSLADYVNKHFAPVGGVSTRQSKDQIGTLLPDSNIEEAERILRDFYRDLKEHGLQTLHRGAQQHASAAVCCEFSVSVGIAEGSPSEQVDVIVARARAAMKKAASFTC